MVAASSPGIRSSILPTSPAKAATTSRPASRLSSFPSTSSRRRRRVAASSSAAEARASDNRSALVSAPSVPGMMLRGTGSVRRGAPGAIFTSGGFGGGARPDDPPSGGRPRVFPSAPTFGVQYSDRHWSASAGFTSRQMRP